MLKIEVEVPQSVVNENYASEYLSNALSAIGYTRGATTAVTAPAPAEQPVQAQTADPVTEKAEETPVASERGKPAPGRARRTKEEIAEDEAADAAEAATSTEETVSETKQNILTGEERTDPADVQEQDKADEKAEVEAARKEPVTLDDIRKAMEGYVHKFGTPATMEDGMKIFAVALGTPPEGNEFWKLSILPQEPEKLAIVKGAWEEAIAKNPFKRDEVK